MVAAQYTILSHILPGHQNWQELFGVGLVLLGSMGSYIYESMLSCVYGPLSQKDEEDSTDLQ